MPARLACLSEKGQLINIAAGVVSSARRTTACHLVPNFAVLCTPNPYVLDGRQAWQVAMRAGRAALVEIVIPPTMPGT